MLYRILCLIFSLDGNNYNIDRKAKEEILESIPLSRFGKAEEVSDLILFLSSEEASYITGQTIHVNGGLFM